MGFAAPTDRHFSSGAARSAVPRALLTQAVQCCSTQQPSATCGTVLHRPCSHPAPCSQAVTGHDRNHSNVSKMKTKDVGQAFCKQSSCSWKDVACPLPATKETQTPPSILNHAGCPEGPGVTMLLQTDPQSREEATTGIFHPLAQPSDHCPNRLEVKL